MKQITLFLLLIVTCIYAAGSKVDKAPDFTLKDLKGRPYKLSKNPSNVKVINFWATWCVPCLAEMNALKKLHTKYASHGVSFVAISVDDNKSSAKVPAYVRSRKLPFTVLLDKEKSLYKRLHIRNVPSLIVLNNKNEIVYRHSGFTFGDEVELEKVLSETLKAIE